MKLLRSILALLAVLITAMSLYSNIAAERHSFHHTTLKASQQHAGTAILSEDIELEENLEESDVEHFLESLFIAILSPNAPDLLRISVQQRRYVNAVANSAPIYLRIHRLSI